MMEEIVLRGVGGLTPNAGGFAVLVNSSTPTPVTGVDAPGFSPVPKFNGANPSGLRAWPAPPPA